MLEDFPLCSLPNASQGTLPPHRPLSIKLPPASTLGLEPSHGKKIIQFKVCIPTLSNLLIFSSFDPKSALPLSINVHFKLQQRNWMVTKLNLHHNDDDTSGQRKTVLGQEDSTKLTEAHLPTSRSVHFSPAHLNA